MTLEWIRFYLTAVFIIIALIGFVFAVIGVWRFDFIMNRMHAGGIGDTFSLFFVVLALIISATAPLVILKLLLPLLFMWFSSPTATHFLSQIEYFTNGHLFDHVKSIKNFDKGK